MDKDFNLDNVILTALKNDANKIDIGNNSFNSLKNRIENSKRGLLSIIKEKFSDYMASMKFNTRKAVISALCSLMIAFSLCGTFIPSVRATAVDDS
jgi:hypothetical protein